MEGMVRKCGEMRKEKVGKVMENQRRESSREG